MQLCMGMVYAQRMLFGCNIIAQYQIQFIFAVPLPGNRCYRIMRLPVRISINKRRLIGIPPPLLQYHVRQCDYPGAVAACQTDDRHGPFNDPGIHILKPFYHKGFLHPCFCHGKFIMAALEMVMA